MVEANKPLYLAEWTLLLAAKKQVIESNQSRRRSRDRWIVLTISSLSCLDSSSTLSFLFCCRHGNGADRGRFLLSPSPNPNH
jgi:hypothetical protein